MKLFISSSITHGEFISYNIDKIVFILFNFFSGFFPSLKHSFHVQFVFGFVLDVLIVVYTPRGSLIKAEVNIYLFFFVNQLLFKLNQYMYFILLTTSFIKLTQYKERVVILFTKCLLKMQYQCIYQHPEIQTC